MADVTLSVAIPLETIIEAVKALNINDKLKLWDAIDEQIAEYEDQNPSLRAEIEQAKAEYQAGNYITMEDYLAQQGKHEK